MTCHPQSTEHLLHDLFDTVGHLMAILELKAGNLVVNMANRRLSDFLDLPDNRVACTPLDAFLVLDSHLYHWLKQHASGMAAPPMFTFECQLRDRTPTVWLECQISPMTTGLDGTLLYGFVAVDITARKNAHDELARMKEQLFKIIDLGTDQMETVTESLRIILNKIPVMICWYHTSPNVLFVNRVFEDLVGWSQEEIRNNDIIAACYPDPEYRQRVLDFMLSGRTDWQDFRLHCRNGDVIETSWTNVQLIPDIQVGIGIDITHRKQTEEAFRRLSRTTLKMLEDDRQAVAKELHDSIGASLAAIKFGLEGRVMAMDDPPAQGQMPLETIIAYLVDTIKETKRISNGLRPLTLDDLGLLPTLTAYVRQLNETYPAATITQDIDINESDLPEDLKIVLYRVAQEALNNVHKHSRASKIDLRLNRTGDMLELSVADNGCGFDVETVLERSDPLSGYGLRSMRERVEICHGRFQIHSTSESGTTVAAHFQIV